MSRKNITVSILAVGCVAAAVWLGKDLAIANHPSSARIEVPELVPAEETAMNVPLDGRQFDDTAELVANAEDSEDGSAGVVEVVKPISEEEMAQEKAAIATSYEKVQADPQAALEILADLSPTASRDAAIIHAVSQWAATDGQAASEWAMEVPESALKDEVAAAVAIARAEKDPVGAAEWVATQMKEGVQQRNAAVAVAQRWVQVDGPAAAEWVTEFPSRDLRQCALDAMLRVWLTVDSNSAHNWIDDAKKNKLTELQLDEVSAVVAGIQGTK